MFTLIRHAITWPLVLCLVFLQPADVLAQTPSSSPATDFQVQPLTDQQMFGADPLWKEFLNAPWSPPRMGPFDSRDPIFDQDPFFMRSQSWSEGAWNDQNEIGFQRDGETLILTLPHSRTELRLQGDFKPVFQLRDFLFFQATRPETFHSKAANDAAYGEGLFFIDKRDLNLEAARVHGDHRAVPVFFLPLLDRGWTTPVTGVENPDLEVVGLRNAEGGAVTLDVSDIYTVSTLEHNNLTMAIAMVLKHHRDWIVKALNQQMTSNLKTFELPYVLPPRGSTAAFGTFFSGMNFDHPADSLQASMSRPHASVADWILPKAHADGLLSPDALDRLLTIGQITGTVFMTSVMAKYTVLRHRMLERRKYIEDKEDDVRRELNQSALDRTTIKYKAKREFKEWFDVFSQGLAVVSGGVGTLSGFIMEYGADRFLGRQGGSSNGMIRWFLEKTFLYGRQRTENVPSNANSFVLGTLILGGIDTVGVAIQMLAVSPVFFPWVAHFFGPQMHQKIQMQFSGQDEAMNNTVTSELIRNFAGYFVSGAYQYASSQRTAMLEIVQPDIENQMRREGKNPLDPKMQSELHARIETRIDRMLTERGLPSRKEFIVSAPAVFRAMAGLMGYKVDREKLDEGAQKDQFLFEKARWGLIHHAIKRAIYQAEALAKMGGDENHKIALKMLKDTNNEYHMFYRLLRNPLKIKKALKEGRKIRKMLTVLSYEGDVLGPTVKYVEQWDKAQYNVKAATIAARLFRQALFGMIQDKPYYLRPSAQELKKYLPEARREAAREITAADLSIGFNEADQEILAMDIVKQKIQHHEQEKEILEWAPKKPDFLERRQIRRAQVRAAKEVAEKLSLARFEDRHLLEPEARELYKEAYRKEMSRIVGLYARTKEESPLVQKAIEAAEAEIEAHMTSNRAFQHFVSGLDDVAKVKFLTHEYVDSYLAKYVDLTVSNSSEVSLTSPEQPGVFQRLRQLELPKKNTLLGRTVRTTLRALESPMDMTAFRPGAMNWLKRNVPWFQDWKSDMSLTFRALWTGMTIGYLSQYYIWQVHFTWSTSLYFFLTSGFVTVAHWWLDRLMMAMGVRPMHDVWSKVKYSALYTWLTYPAYIPFFFFLDDFNDGFEKHVGLPLHQAIDHVIKTCEALLGT